MGIGSDSLPVCRVKSYRGSDISHNGPGPSLRLTASVARQDRPQSGDGFGIQCRSDALGCGRPAPPQEEETGGRVALDFGGHLGFFDQHEAGAGGSHLDDQIRLPRRSDARRERLPGVLVTYEPNPEERVAEDPHGVIDQLRAGQDLVSFIVVTDEVPR